MPIKSLKTKKHTYLIVIKKYFKIGMANALIIIN